MIRRRLRAIPATGADSGAMPITPAKRLVVGDDAVPRVHAIRPAIGPGRAKVVIQVGNQAILISGEPGLRALRDAVRRAEELAEWAFEEVPLDR
jgi:hypothetical protein